MEPKIALVTGGNRGVGFEICRQLARQGMKVILTARSIQKGGEAAKQLQAEGLDAVFCPLDVTSEKSIRQAAQFVKTNFGRLDILINNAGIQVDAGLKGINADIDKIRETMETNVYGPLRLAQVLIPLMRRTDAGKIINISSRMGALHGMKGGAPGYRISKAALNAVTRILSTELEGTGITVNSVSPGHVRTALGGPDAPQSIEEGADTAVWLAVQDSPASGKFFRERGEFGW